MPQKIATILFFLTLIFISIPFSSQAYCEDGSESSIEQYGITWTFDREYQCGQFVNGDYWVVDEGSGVTVNIFPEPANGKNGSQINPQSSSEPFDDRTYNYYPSLLFESGSVLYSGDSLVSTISEVNEGSDEDVLGRYVADEHAFIQSVAVLTTLSFAPLPNSFRPPIFGDEKNIYNFNDADLSVFAEMIAPSSTLSHIADDQKSITENYAKYLSGPWINWGSDWQGRLIHPLDNMPNYYEYCYYVYSESGLIINSDMEGKEAVIKNFIQLGIDTYFVTKNGFGDRTVSKFPILVAGIALNQPDFYNTDYPGFKEILQTYYGTGWSSPTPSVIWRQKIGNEHEETHPSNWDNIAVPAGGGDLMEAYRRCCSSVSWSGIALAIHAMNIVNEWNHQPFLDYVDRWHYEAGAIDEANMTIIHNYYPTLGGGDSGSTESAFTSDMWEAYRDDFYPTVGPSNPIGLSVL